MEDDAHLVRLTGAGDTSAFGQLYDRYAGIVRAICFDETRDLNSSQELAQEVFLRAFAGIRKLKAPDRFGPWLVSIAKFVCREWRRTRRRDKHQYTSQLPEPAGTVDTTPNDAAPLLQAIARLPDQERLALHSFYLNGESADAARRLLGLSRPGFYKVLERARRQLALLLKDAEETIR